MGQVTTEYIVGLGNSVLKNKDEGWKFTGKISDNYLPISGTIIKDSFKIRVLRTFDKYIGTLYFKNGTTEINEIPSPETANLFSNWLTSAFSKIKKIDEQYNMDLTKKRTEALERKNVEYEQKWKKIASQLPYYIWQPSEIKNIYDNNPARLRSTTQNKYVAFYGTIADIKESRNVEWNQFLQDYVEYKYYTIRLNGGIYFESRNANFVSNLSRGQQSYFVAEYTDRQSFNRPLFDLVMYARSIEELSSLLRKTNIGLDRLVSR